LFLNGCTSTEKGAVVGGGLGAGTGAIIGHQSGHTAAGALIGAAVGGLGGALIGHQMETKYCPVCGRGYTSEYAYCSVDGAPLKAKGETASAPSSAQPSAPAQAPSSGPKTKYCATCGMQYSSDFDYCTKDGTKLSPIK